MADPAGDFLASHALAQQGDAWSNLNALIAGGGTSSPAPPSVAPSAPGGAPAPPSPARGEGEATGYRPIGQRVLDVFGQLKDRFSGDVAGSFEQLKNDWLQNRQMSEAAGKLPFWQSLKATFEAQLQSGKLPVDAFKLMMSPIGAAFDTGNNAAAKAIGSVTGLNDDQVERLTQDLGSSELGLGPKAGLKGALERPPSVAPSAPGGAPATPSPARGEGEVSNKHDFLFAGRAALKATAEDKNKAADYLSGKTPDNPVQASLDTLSDANGAREVVKKVAGFIPEGEVKSDAVLRAAAYAVQRSPDDILAGLKTALPTDEELLSWKMTMEAGGAQLKQAADAYIADPTPEKFEAATRAFALASKMVENWDGVGTEQARAFRARQLTAEASPEQTKSILDILRNAGPDNVEDAIKRAAALQDPAKVPAWLSILRRATSRDSVVAAWTNLLLSNVPKTLSKKLFGDGFAAMWQLATHGTAELAGKLPEGSTEQLLYGYWSSLGDGMAAAWKAMRQGGSQFHSEYQTVEGLEKQRTSELAKGMANTETPTPAAIALLRALLPTDYIGAADDFAKVIHYRAELRRLSWAAAAKEGADDLPARIAELMGNPPPALHEQALAYALRNSYQEPLAPIAKAAQDFADKVNISPPWLGKDTGLPLGRFILPFVKVPSNLVRYAYRMSPLGLIGVSKALREELSAGGARAALAKGSMALGSALAGTAAIMAANDQLTGYGPKDPDERRFWLATHQPYSVKIGSTWLGYSGLHPLGMFLGATADTVGIARFAHDRDWEDAVGSLLFGTAHALLSPTFMLGASGFINAVNNPDDASARQYLEDTFTGAVPGEGATAIDNASDEWRRQHNGLLEAIAARTPGYSKALPPQVTIWGDPLPRTAGWPGGALGRAFSPIPMRGENELAQPIDKWIWDNREAFPHDADQGRLGITPPGQFQTYSSGQVSAQVQLTSSQLHALRVLAGNGVKDPVSKLGAKDAFNALVEGRFPDARTQQQWNAAAPELKAQTLQGMWAKYRDAAKQQLLAENAGLRDQVTQKLTARQKALTAPQFGGGP